MNRRRLGAGAVACVAMLALSGCGLGSGLYNVDLPGGADVGDHPYTVTVQFSDALDLVPQAGVKVNDVAVGRVEAISLERNGRVADVKVELNGAVQLPANAVASVQQTSLLGEKYVALSAPTGLAPQGRLRGGDTIALSRTSAGIEVEQVFGALSLLLNGGGIDQLDTITKELVLAAKGHEGDLRQFFASSTAFLKDVNAHSGSITRALTALNTLATTLRRNNDAIARILRSLEPGLAVLADQNAQLKKALVALNKLADTGVRTLQASKEDVLTDLHALAPILSQLVQSGSSLPQSLQVLVTYPFPDSALSAVKGDYLNAFVTTALNTPGGKVIQLRQLSAGSGANGVAAPPSGLLPNTTSAAAGMPGVLDLAATGTSAGGR